MTPALRLVGVQKRFGSLLAIDNAALEVLPGEIHAILGENGAGKTSLMNVVAGVYRADAGRVEIDGQQVSIHAPEDARRVGIGMVHQEQRLVARYTAPENIALGHREPRWLTLHGYFRRLAATLTERYRLPIDPEKPIWDLPIGRRQRVELVKVLHHGARLIILDEPTVNLAPAEVETFFSAVRRLTSEGRTVVFITHKLDEVMRYTDRVTIMRAGRVVDTFPTTSTTRERLNVLMVGAIDPTAREAPAQPVGEPVLRVRGLSTRARDTRVNLEQVDLDVYGGEIVAVAGVAGNGQTELAEAIAGNRHDYEGDIVFVGNQIRGWGPGALSRLGLAYVPENRREVGLIGGQSVAVNLALRTYDRQPFSRRGWLDRRAMRRHALDLIERYGIRPADPDMPAGRLSGGNQQRVIIAREFAGQPRLILADNFTRGLDPRSTHQFTAELLAHRRRGAGVLWLTGDLAEALVCDRVAVMNRGRVVAVLPRAEATRENIGLLMSGDVLSAAP
jgi:general nucleoside transport system ATP-binding protein